MGEYDDERHTKTDLNYCAGTVSLFFDGETLQMFAEIDGRTSTKSYQAVSGKALENNVFDYSIESQKRSNLGPIPEGKYWVYPFQFWENGFLKRGSYEDWGNYRITLHPDKQTETYGRGGFFIHGGFNPGSAGCVDLTSNMNQFYEDIMKAIGKNRHCQIHLWVDYDKKTKNRTLWR